MNTCNVENMVGKVLTYKGEDFSIDSHEVHNWLGGVECLYFGLSPIKGKAKSKTYIPTKAFDKGIATTEDAELMEFVSKCNQDYDALYASTEASMEAKREQDRLARLQEEREAEEQKAQWRESQIANGAQMGKDDARAKVSTLYRIFTSKEYKCLLKANGYPKEFRDAYVVAYEDEKAVMKKAKLIQSRARNCTLDSYPGDLDKLVSWMREHLIRIDVFASPDKIENEQMAVDAINERDGTNYQVKFRQGQYVAYEAFFSDPKSAPKEFLSWRVSKHDYTTSDLSKRVMAHPMDVETGKMTCNSLVKELVYSSEYAFHLGKASR